MSGQLPLFSGPSPSRRRGQSEGGELTGGAGAGPEFDHVWAWGRPAKALPPYEPQRKGRRCRVVCRAKPGLSLMWPLDGRGVTHLPLGRIEEIPDRHGLTRCSVHKYGRAPANVAVELSDGELVCAPRWAVRRAR